MKFLFSELKILPSTSINQKFVKIPLFVDEIWIEGDFRKSSYFEHSFVGEALSMLPMHIKSIKFSGKFQYDYYRLCPAIEGYYYRSMGGFLADFMPYIPAHIHQIKFNFIQNYTFEHSGTPYTSLVTKEFMSIFQNLPASIRILDLNEMKFNEPAETLGIQKMYTSIPKTVKQVKMHQFSLSDYPVEQRQKIFEHFSDFLEELSLANMDILKSQNHAYLSSIFAGLGDNLKSLDLSFNRLCDAKPISVQTLIANIPRSIHHLNLSGNLLAYLRDFHSILLFMPSHLQSLDIAENQLLDLPESDFIKFFSKFEQLTHLRLFERLSTGYLFHRHQANFALIPSTVKTLEISQVEEKELEFIQAGGLHHLPAHVDTLDLSNNKLFFYNAATINRFLGRIAPHLKKLILANNKLMSASIDELQASLASIDERIESIGLYGNGLDRIPYSIRQSWLSLLPDRVYDFSQDKLSLHHQGKIRECLLRIPDLYFRTISRIRMQSDWAAYFLVISQVLQQKNLTAKLMMHVCTFAYDQLGPSKQTTQALSLLLEKASFFKGQQHRMAADDLLKSIKLRLQITRGGRLDLSFCGLHNLKNPHEYQQLFALIPSQVHTLNLRANHFKLEPTSFAAFQQGIKFLPAHIRFLDLSLNGFEWSNPSDLKTQLTHLPKTIEYLSLGEERPVSLTASMQRQVYPHYYSQLLAGCHTVEDKLKTLLMDYSKANSFFKRLIFGFWNRQHLPEVNRLLVWMTQGYLIHIQDILEHLHSIRMINDAGSLSKISHFIHVEAYKPKDTIRVKLIA